MNSKKIISFCLWGNNPKYTFGAVQNAEIALSLFPEWICRFYVGMSTPKHTINELKSMSNVEVIIMNELGSWNSMFWRFFPISEDETEIMLSRDVDSRLTLREKLCIDEFIESDMLFHSMRDHPWHNGIMGGMWGAKRGVLKDMKELIDVWEKTDKWQTDQSFLNSIIYPIISETYLLHDSIHLKNFPTKRENYSYVGEVFDSNNVRSEHYCLFTWEEYKHLN